MKMEKAGEKMNVINVTPEMRTLPLGRRYENERTQFVFDVSDWLEEFPEGDIVLLNMLPWAAETYEAEIEGPDEEGKITWTITSTETATEGTGCCQLMITENTAIARSMAWDTKIGKGLPPAPQEEEST